jgi:hypothetical protein
MALLPATDETLRSYIARLAALYDSTTEQAVDRLGLKGVDRRTYRGFGLVIEPERAQHVSDVTGLSVEQIDEMLVGDLFARVTGEHLAAPLAAQTLVQYGRHWVFLSGSRYCPRCLADRDGAWKRTWRVPWHFACLDHRCLLEHTCPSCGGDQITTETSRVGTWLVEPGCCTIRRPDPATGRRSHQPVCGAPLAEHPVRQLHGDTPLLSAQQLISSVINDDSGATFGERVRCAEYLVEARSLSALVLRAATSADVVRYGPAVQRAFAEWEGAREHTLTVQSRLRARASTPRDAAVFGACAAVAVEAFSGDKAEAAEQLRWLAARLGWPDATALQRRFSQSARVAEVLTKSPDRRRHLRVRRIDWRLPADTDVAFTPDNVPTMLWREAWEAAFEPFLRTRRELPVRTFLSAALLRCAFNVSWTDACDTLGLADDTADRFRDYGAALTARPERAAALFDGLATVARVVSASPYLIDYATRRRKIRDVQLTGGEWRELCESSGVHVGRGSRKLNAEMWLFAEITGSPLQQSGAWTRRQRHLLADQPAQGDQLWKDYVRFYRTELPRLHKALTATAVRRATELDGDRAAGHPAARVLRCLTPSDFR